MSDTRRSTASLFAVLGVLGLYASGHGLSTASAHVLRVAAPSSIGDLDPFAYERSLAASDPAHLPRVTETGIAIGDHATIDARGMHVTMADRTLRLGATAVHRASSDSGTFLRDVAPSIVGPEARAERAPGIVEWWRSLPSGLEHGFTLDTRPAGRGALVVELAIEGATPRLSDDHVVLLAGEREVARYGGLFVRDVSGRRVAAHLGVVGATITITIEDAAARYPLVVDPILAVSEDAILASDIPVGRSGLSVSITADGTRALVGAPTGDGAIAGTGVARVYFFFGGVWSLEATLDVPAGEVDDFFGSAAAISGDGLYAIVGAPGDDTAAGADSGSAHVFRRTVSTWSLHRTLVRSAAAVADQFGTSVAIDATGARAIVGAPTDRVGAVSMGTASVFVRTPSSWAEEAVLSASDGAGGDQLGASVALSDDGLFAAVGAPGDDTAGGVDAGSVRTFANVGMVWGPEATVLATSGAAGDALGTSVDLDRTTTRLIAGAPNDDTGSIADAGSARVFLHAGASWGQEAVLYDTSAADTLAGWSVAISGDGLRALVGAPGADLPGGTDFGAARIFSRAGTTWSTAADYAPSTPAAREDVGAAVALTATGDRGLVGVPGDDGGPGFGSGSARVIGIRPADALGTACTSGSSCLSGFCADGVCCNSACGGGAATDCQACAASITGGTNGTCAAARATTVCRPAVGVCDAPEVCNGVSQLCAPDVRVPRGEICRPAAGPCDHADICDGTLVNCTSDLRVLAGTVCNPAAGPCDVDDVCDGTSIACPAAFRPAGASCRDAANECDVTETCSGASAACPTDAFAPSSVPCGGAPSGDCDVADHCAGTSASCVATFAAPGTSCRASLGPCDVEETCSGASAGCPADAVAPDGTVCAAAAGSCDVDDVCDGTGVACASRVAAAGVTCRASSAACDPAEVCDGAITSCPGDVIACDDAGATADAGLDVDVGSGLDAGSDVDVGTGLDVGAMVDAGGGGDVGAVDDTGPRDGGGAIDAASSDAGTVPPAMAGCACRATSASRTRPFGWLLMGALATLLAHRRRR